MLLRSNVLRTCSVLLLCVSLTAAYVEQSEYAKCGYEYTGGLVMNSANFSLIKQYTEGEEAVGVSSISLTQVMDICAGMDGTGTTKDCGFIKVVSDSIFMLYTVGSWELRNTSDATTSADSESYLYVKDPEGCVSFDSYGYKYGAFTYTASDKCPSSRRLEQCSHQNDTSDASDDCPTSKSLCCFNDGASSGEKCTNSYLYTCDVPSLTSEIGSATITSPSSDILSTETDQNIVYIGEKVTVTCDTGLMFAYADGWNVDSDSKTTLTCVLDAVYKVTTDMVSTLRQGMCTDTCKGVYYDSTTTTVNQAFPARKYTMLDVACKDGYGLEGGYTSESPQCTSTSSEWQSITNCTSCEIPTAPTGSVFTPSVRVKPTGTVTTSCETGYSLLSTQSTTATCKQNTSSATGWTLETPDTCAKMCSLKLVYSGDYPHSVPGNVTYLAYGSEIELSCPGGTLPVGQSSTLKCETAGEVIKPLYCDVECDTSSAVAHAYLKVQGATAETQVPAGTVITAECKSTYGVYYGKPDSFNCSGMNYNSSADAGSRFFKVPECLRVCTLEIGSTLTSLGQATVIVGTPRNVSSGAEILKGETVNIPCKEEGFFVVKDHKTSQNLTCGTENQQLYPDECQKPCKISDLSGGNNNTSIFPDPEVGIGSKVTFTCNDNYQLGNGANNRDASLVTCKSGAILEPSTIPVESTCYPIPTMTAEGAGEKSIEVSLSLPNDFDRDNVTITKVIFTKTSGGVISTETNINGLQTDATQDFTLSYGSYSSDVTVTANVYYDGVTSAKTVSASSPTGPPALTFSSAPTVTFTGRTSFTILAPGNNKDSILSDYSTAKLRADFYLKTSKRATGSVVFTMDVSLDVLSGNTAVSIPSGKLEEGKSYTMKLTTYLSDAEGGSIEVDVSTGLDAPTISEEILTSTSNKLTITLSSGSVQDATYTVYYTVNGGSEQSEQLAFSGGVASFTQTGLTAEVKYTYVVCVLSTTTATKSTSKTIVFTQGPTEPTSLSYSTMTDTGVFISWTAVDLNTYTVTLKEVDANAVYTTVSTNNTSNGNYTYTDLSAGQKYEVSVAAEMVIAGAQYSSADSVTVFTTYHCDVNKIKANFELYSSSGSIVTSNYLRSDSSEVFNISCVTGYEPDVVDGTAVDNTTSCIGANSWTTYSDCKIQEEAAKQENDSDVVVGVVLGILAVVIIIAIILILIYRRNQRKSSSNRYNPSAEEKKSNEKGRPEAIVEVEVVEVEPVLVVPNNHADIPPPDPVYDVELEIKADNEKERDEKDIELDMDVVYENNQDLKLEPEIDNDKRGTPDIPEAEPVYDNDIADRGDNVSQEVKIEFQDNDEDGNEVHENKLADANV